MNQAHLKTCTEPTLFFADIMHFVPRVWMCVTTIPHFASDTHVPNTCWV